MYKNQLQEVAQRSCFNLPSYSCVREGPDHAPRFKASVTFNGEVFSSPNYCSTLRHAEHSAAELALSSLSNAHSSLSFANKILDETGVYKNLLQEIAQRVGAPLPLYATFRSGLGHLPVFTGIVELAGISFTGEPAKNKKQAEKNAAMSAWSSLKQLAKEAASSSSEPENNDELEQITIARALLNYRLKEKIAVNSSSIPFTKKFPMQNPRPTSPQQHHVATSRILPLICQKAAPRNRSASLTAYDSGLPLHQPHHGHEGHFTRPQKFTAAGPAPYVPIRQFRAPCHRMAPPVTIRSTVPVFSAPPAQIPPQVMMRHSPVRIAPPVCIRQTVPVYSAPAIRKEDPPIVQKEAPPVVQKEEPPAFVKEDPLIVRKEVIPDAIVSSPAQESASLTLVTDDTKNTTADDKQECEAVQSLEELKI